MKQFLSVKDVRDIPSLVQTALDFKQQPLSDSRGKGKRIGLIFLNPSLRTRLSTQIAAQNLGMEAVVFNASSDGWQLEFAEGAIMNGNKAEHIKDAAPVLGTYFDLLAVRTFPGLKDRKADYSENVLNQFIKYSGVPLISLESATVHPLQSFADVITITEHLDRRMKKKPKVVLTWAPHIKALPQCVANSFSEWMLAWGQTDFVIAHPEGYALKESFTRGATITHDQSEALKDADFVYVKNWSAYDDYGSMPPVLQNWMPDAHKFEVTNNARVMHCLPVRRNVELSDDLLDSPRSLVTQQAGNRVWAAQAVISTMLNSTT